MRRGVERERRGNVVNEGSEIEGRRRMKEEESKGKRMEQEGKRKEERRPKREKGSGKRKLEKAVGKLDKRMEGREERQERNESAGKWKCEGRHVKWRMRMEEEIRAKKRQ